MALRPQVPRSLAYTWPSHHLLLEPPRPYENGRARPPPGPVGTGPSQATGGGGVAAGLSSAHCAHRCAWPTAYTHAVPYTIPDVTIPDLTNATESAAYLSPLPSCTAGLTRAPHWPEGCWCPPMTQQEPLGGTWPTCCAQEPCGREGWAQVPRDGGRPRRTSVLPRRPSQACLVCSQ